jgi:hypothetical protein
MVGDIRDRQLERGEHEIDFHSARVTERNDGAGLQQFVELIGESRFETGGREVVQQLPELFSLDRDRNVYVLCGARPGLV